MNIRPIRTESNNEAALGDIAASMESDPASGTPKGDRLDVLAALVPACEARRWPIDAPDPVQAIKFRIEQGSLTVKNLEPLIGNAQALGVTLVTSNTREFERVPGLRLANWAA